VLFRSSIRDAAGAGVDLSYADPVIYTGERAAAVTVTAARALDLRANLLPADKVVEGAALDRYLFIRDAYLQRRRNLVYDGEPPRLEDPDDDDAADQPKPPPSR
jgi:phospholipid-binding lipoprotein MlaA